MSIWRARQKSDTTPPASLVKDPVTPPPSEKSGTSELQIIREIECRKSGRGSSTNPWHRYILSQAAYERLEERFLEDGFVQDKLKFDYFPSAKVFVLRMPSLLHEQLIANVGGDVRQQLLSIAKADGPASEFARQIEQNGSGTITFSDPRYGRHDPDDSFQHCGAYFPGVIFEISYTQKRKDLARLAHDYIIGSDGNIRVVVGIDVDYKDKSATLSIWQPRLQVNEAGEEELVTYQLLSNQEFRKENGEVNPQTDLQLHLEDFAPPFLSKDTKFGTDISISSTSLCAYLHNAEQRETNTKQKNCYIQPLKKGVKRRHRSSSSIEQLNTDDELQFQQEEERASNRSIHGDEEYEDS